MKALGSRMLPAHDRTHARAAGRAVQVVHHGRIEHAVFTGLADARHADQRVLQAGLENFFGLPHALAPEVAGVSQLGFVVVDVEVDRLRALAFKNDHVPAGHLELGAPVAT